MLAGLYPHDKKLAKEKLRALATPYAQAIAGTPSLMRWDGWWRTLAFEYTAASPRRNGASTVATSGGPGDATEENADADLSRTTVLHVASELHYPGRKLHACSRRGSRSPECIGLAQVDTTSLAHVHVLSLMSSLHLVLMPCASDLFAQRAMQFSSLSFSRLRLYLGAFFM